MICLGYPPEVGGVEAAARTLSVALVKQGHRVTVIARSVGSLEGRSIEDGVEVHRVPISGRWPAGGRFVWHVAKTARGLPRHDVVHAHMASAPAVAALVVGRRWRSPVVVKPSSAGGPWGGNLASVRSRPGGSLRVRVVSRYASAFVVVSEEINQTLARSWGVPATKIVRIPNGVDLARFEPTSPPTPSGPRRFLYVGRLDRAKGVDVLLEAWRLAREPGILTIAGDGPERAALQRAAPSSVRFLGAVADPASCYRQADVFVLPSRREGLSNALLEAVAAGLPVIATSVGETTGVLGDQGNLVSPDDPAALAAALSSDPPPPLERTAFAAEYGVETVATRHAELYERLIEAGTP